MAGDTRAQVIVLAGPSGSGKSHLASRLGLPTLQLDDFYRNGDEVGLPLVRDGANAGLVDWDDPGAWHQDLAMQAIRELCAEPQVRVPVYEFGQDRAVGSQIVERGDSPVFVAEGIFAPHIVAGCAAEGLLQAAYCLQMNPSRVYLRRLWRDLRESRKPALVAARRGVRLAQQQGEFVNQAEALGCELATVDQIINAVAKAPVR